MKEDENYFFETVEAENEKRYFVVICYDIQNNKRRTRFSKFLEHYAVRVQKSVFEAELSQKKYNELLEGIDKFMLADDSVRVYKVRGGKEIESWGKDNGMKIDEVIII